MSVAITAKAAASAAVHLSPADLMRYTAIPVPCCSSDPSPLLLFRALVVHYTVLPIHRILL